MATQHQFPLVHYCHGNIAWCELLTAMQNALFIAMYKVILDLGLALSSTPALVYAPSLLFVCEFRMGASDAMCSILITRQLFTLTTFYLCDPSC